MNLREATRLVQLQIRECAGEEDLSQAKELAGYVTGVAPGAFMPHGDMELTPEQMEELGTLAKRRAGGEPLQYILGGWEFMGLPFYLEEGVLIPRQDTETLCEKAIALIRERGYQTALDLCCGSGCIGISLAKLTGISVTMTDLSRVCTEIAGENERLNEVTCQICEGDLFEPVKGRSFDMICCNPPYLTEADMKSLQREVSFEPESALCGGTDGLQYYRRIAGEYKTFLNSGGVLILEIGAAQGEEIARLFPGAEILLDYAGHPRVAVVEDTCWKS